MNLGMYLALIAVALWIALCHAGVTAPQFIWRVLWLPVALAAILLQWLVYRMTGVETAVQWD